MTIENANTKQIGKTLRLVAVPVILYFDLPDGIDANAYGYDAANETIRELTRKYVRTSDLLDYSVNEPVPMRLDLGSQAEYEENDHCRAVEELVLSEDDLLGLGYEINEDSDQHGYFYWRNDLDASDISFESKSKAIQGATDDAMSNTLSRCLNCEKVHTEETLEEISDLSMRVAPGEPSPSGQCPDCGALCHQITL